MKRGIKLLILAGSLILISLAAWGISAWQAQQNAPVPLTEGDLIFSLAGTKTLSWTCGEDTYSFDISGTEWKYIPDETYRISAESKKYILDEITQIHSRKVIEQPGDLADYGLAEPRCTIVADDITIAIGDDAAMGNQCYLSIGDGKVYLVSNLLISPFQYTLEDMVEFEEIPDLSTVIEITLTTEDETLNLVNAPDEHKDYSDYYQWFLYDGTAYTRIDQGVATNIVTYLSGIDWITCADYNLQNPAAYGLDVPVATYEITYLDGGEEKTATLLIGDGNEDGIFAMFSDSRMVYTMDATAGTVLAQISTQTLTCTDVVKPQEEALTGVDITVGGQTYTLTHNTQWQLNGTAVELTGVLNKLNALTGAAQEGLSQKGLTPELTLVFHTQEQIFTVTFYRYDGTNCVAVLNDEAPMLVSRSQVVTITEDINTLVLN